MGQTVMLSSFLSSFEKAINYLSRFKTREYYIKKNGKISSYRFWDGPRILL